MIFDDEDGVSKASIMNVGIDVLLDAADENDIVSVDIIDDKVVDDRVDEIVVDETEDEEDEEDEAKEVLDDCITKLEDKVAEDESSRVRLVEVVVVKEEVVKKGPTVSKVDAESVIFTNVGRANTEIPHIK